MPKLSDTQTVLLATAAARPDRSILPAPETLKVKGAALERTLAVLLRHGLIAQASPGDEGQSSEPGRAASRGSVTSSLIITSAGLSAIGTGAETGSDRNSATEPGPTSKRSRRPSRRAPQASWASCVIWFPVRTARPSKT